MYKGCRVESNVRNCMSSCRILVKMNMKNINYLFFLWMSAHRKLLCTAKRLNLPLILSSVFYPQYTTSWQLNQNLT